MITSNLSWETVTYILTYYGYSFMLIFGNTGNVFNIVLFLRKKLRTTSCNNYFLASAVTNLVALNINIIPLLYTNIQPWELTIVYCKIRPYLTNISLQISRFLIVMACFDRYALCSTNAHLRKFCSIRIARRYVIPCIVLIWFIIPLHRPLYTTVLDNHCVLIGIVALYNGFYMVIATGIIPPSLMLLFSFLIFYNLKLRQRRRQVHPFIIGNRIVPLNDNQRQKIKDQQVLAMLLIQVLFYVISSTPYAAARLYLILKMKNNDDDSNETEPRIAFILFITDMLRFFTPFISFYLYILVSHLYRKEMKLIILSIYHRCILLLKRDHNQPHNINLAGNSISVRQSRYEQQTESRLRAPNRIVNK